jgi:2-polyprenyl-3-methyl-5-hydroxy-6-metoxy-1,4-benzoquinol methylase
MMAGGAAPGASENPMTAGDALAAWRSAAAQASAGTSEEALYRRALAWVRAEGVSGTVLDYGAGTGTLSRMLFDLHQFDKMIGADLMQRPSNLPEAIEWLAQDLNHPLSIPDDHLDALLSVEVIEHLENPRAVARDWFRMLKPGGRLFFTTPNADSWRSLVTLALKGHHQEFTDENYPAHITALVGTDLRRILTEAGFEAIECAYALTSRLYGRLTWAGLLPSLKPGRRTGKHAVVTARKPL